MKSVALFCEDCLPGQTAMSVTAWTFRTQSVTVAWFSVSLHLPTARYAQYCNFLLGLPDTQRGDAVSGMGIVRKNADFYGSETDSAERENCPWGKEIGGTSFNSAPNTCETLSINCEHFCWCHCGGQALDLNAVFSYLLQHHLSAEKNTRMFWKFSRWKTVTWVVNHGEMFDDCNHANKWEWVNGTQTGQVGRWQFFSNLFNRLLLLSVYTYSHFLSVKLFHYFPFYCLSVMWLILAV